MRKYLGLMVLIILVTSMLLIPAAANAQTDTPPPCNQYIWNLDSTSVPGTTPGTTFYMQDAQGSSTQSGVVTIGVGNAVTWVSDQIASPTAVTISDGLWALALGAGPIGLGQDIFPIADTASSWAGVRIGYYDTSFHPFSTTTLSIAGMSTNLIQLDIDLGGNSVPINARLAVEITNNSAGQRTIDTSGLTSKLATPCCGSGGFVPEATTIILLSAGLLGLGGFIFIKRKRAKNSVKT